jgi:hypothetical protein
LVLLRYALIPVSILAGYGPILLEAKTKKKGKEIINNKFPLNINRIWRSFKQQVTILLDLRYNSVSGKPKSDHEMKIPVLVWQEQEVSGNTNQNWYAKSPVSARYSPIPDVVA